VRPWWLILTLLLAPFFWLFRHLLDRADHVEGIFRQVVVFAVNNRLEALDRVFQLARTRPVSL
jgi:hypothetical protein